MKMKNSTFLLIILLIVSVLIAGCSNSTTQTQSLSDCSRYDGTWKGVISDSGSLIVTRYDSERNEIITHNPFTAQYDIEMTIKCFESGAYLDPDLTSISFQITHAKVSHPLFGCTQGCIPIPFSEKGGLQSWLFAKQDGFGTMQIAFENGATIDAFTEDDRLRINPDGKTMELYIPENVENWETIGSVGGSIIGEEYRTIETDNCERLGGEGNCDVEYINKNTMILNKIS